MITRGEKDWYRDALIYQLHVKSFFDSDDSGVGDFAGVVAKLDYIRDLGATAIWLMPFYPSPLRDDGYDISDYRGINPSYGTMPKDFQVAFVKAAHERGIRVITELVINHTSDQASVVPEARGIAKPGSAGARFLRLVAIPIKKYEGHTNHFSRHRKIELDLGSRRRKGLSTGTASTAHQPDLNFDNPEGARGGASTSMRYWLDLGRRWACDSTPSPISWSVKGPIVKTSPRRMSC